MKLGVIYDSKTGNTKSVAEYIVNGMQKVKGVEAKAFNILDVDEEYIKSCNGVVFGSPTYGGGPTSDFYSWFEKKTSKLSLSGKLGGAFATGQYIHGCENNTINTIIILMLVKGMMVYSGGASFGTPVIHLGPVEISPETQNYKELFEIYGERFAKQAVKVFAE